MLYMPTRNVVLTDQQTEILKRLVPSGRYQNASEVLREDLRLIERQELENEAHLKALREAAKIGIADMESGCFHTFDTPEPLHNHFAALAGNTVDGPNSEQWPRAAAGGFV